MSERIREIKVLHFRGLPDYSCSLKGKNLVVLGGNGKGKSGIVDGIEFVFAGRVRRFYGEGTGAIDAENAIRHVQRKGEPVVELYFTPTNGCARRNLSGLTLTTGKSAIESYMSSHPRVEGFILRRNQILEFICDQDAERYKKYIHLLNLTSIETMQKGFVEAAEKAEVERQKADQTLRFLLSVFRDTDDEWCPETLGSILDRCSEKVFAFGIEDLREWTQLEAAILRLEAKRSPETKAKVDAFNKAINSLERQLPGGLPELVGNVNKLQERLCELKVASADAAASAIIQEAVSYFEFQKDITQCPVCQQNLDDGYAKTFEKLRQRKVALAELLQVEERRSKVLDQLVTGAQRFADQLDKDLENESVLGGVDIQILRDARASALRWMRGFKHLMKQRSLGIIAFPPRLEAISSLRDKLRNTSIAQRNALIPANE